MKGRKTKVQKLENKLRQAEKCISDLEVIVHAQNLTLLKHDKELSIVSSDSAKLWDKVRALQESERHLNGLAFAQGQKLESLDNLSLNFEKRLHVVAKSACGLCDLVGEIRAKVYLLEKGFWKRLTNWLFGKKVSAKCE